MSTNEDRTLPATWEEYQRARREAFVRGGTLALQYGLRRRNLEGEAALSYPITRKAPRTIILESGATARGTENGVEIDGFGVREVNVVVLRQGTIQALAELARNPFEEVSE